MIKMLKQNSSQQTQPQKRQPFQRSQTPICGTPLSKRPPPTLPHSPSFKVPTRTSDAASCAAASTSSPAGPPVPSLAESTSTSTLRPKRCRVPKRLSLCAKPTPGVGGNSSPREDLCGHEERGSNAAERFPERRSERLLERPSELCSEPCSERRSKRRPRVFLLPLPPPPR